MLRDVKRYEEMRGDMKRYEEMRGYMNSCDKIKWRGREKDKESIERTRSGRSARMSRERALLHLVCALYVGTLPAQRHLDGGWSPGNEVHELSLSDTL